MLTAQILIIFLFKGYTQHKDLDEKDVDGSNERKLGQNILKTENDKMKKTKKILFGQRNPSPNCKVMVQHHNFPHIYGLHCPLFLDIKYHKYDHICFLVYFGPALSQRNHVC